MTDNTAPRPPNTESTTVRASDPPIPLSPTRVLDHRMFPHLVDLIIENAHPELLLVLRRTCWEMCERVDAALARHLLVSSCKVHYTDLTSWLGRCKRLPCLHRLVQPVRGHLPDFDRIQRCLVNAEVVELQQGVRPDHFLQEEPIDFARVHTVKYHAIQAGASWGSRGVYKDLGGWLALFPRVKTLMTLTDAFTFRLLPLLPHSLERVVMVFRELEVGALTRPTPGPFEWPAHLAEVIFLCADWGPAIELQDDPFKFIYSLIDTSRPSRIRFTFVHLHETDPGDFQLPPAYTPDLVEDMLTEYIKKQLGRRNPHWTDDDVARDAATVEFISVTEYSERVGGHQMLYEVCFTQEYDWGCR